MQHPGMPLRILVVRPDRIGDVVLSTPVFEVLKRHYSRSRITVMVREEVAPLVRGLTSVDDVLIYDPRGRHAGVRGFFRLIADIRERSFQVAVVLHSRRRISAALFGAGVRHRVGPFSKIHSFLFFNRGIRQRRSEVEMHEADYNLQLLRKLGIRVGTRNVQTRVALNETVVEEARAWLRAQGWMPGAGRPLIAIHPGMGGSALNWPESHYVELIRNLLEKDHDVLITGGLVEGSLQERIQSSLQQTPRALPKKPIYFLATPSRRIDFLGGLFSHADVVVAPSTGPLHLAVALGKPVVSFYPPVRVQSAIRWGPYLSEEGRASVMVPEVYCGQDFACRGNLCHYYPCMKSITVAQALKQVNRHLENREKSQL